VRLRRQRPSSAADPTVPVVPAPSQTVVPCRTPVNPLTDPEFVAGLRAVPSGLDDGPVVWRASDLSGVRPDGSAFGLDFDSAQRPVLLVFLSLNCDGCDLFWSGLRNEPPLSVDIVVVTKGPATLAEHDVEVVASGLIDPVVMSDSAWTDFRVTSYPFLVLVEAATRRILGERVGFGWTDIESLLSTLAGS